MTRSRPLRLTALLLGAVVLLAAPACSSDEPAASKGPVDFSGYVRTPRPSVGSVSLPAADGAPVTMTAPSGGLRIVYFGYTFCPDVCPTTMLNLKRAIARLRAEDRQRLSVDMVTIDPSRDTAAKLTDYVTTFIPTATAVRTEDQTALRAAARAFGADYEVEVGADGEEEVSHTGDLYAVDDRGEIVITWPFGTQSPDLARDLARLLRGERPPSDHD